MSYLIGLNGRAGAGKDTACGFIKEWGEEHGYTVKREAFADRLKLSAARTFFPEIKMEDAVAWCNEFKVFGRVGVQIGGDGPFALSGDISGREFLQRYGTEAHREVFGQSFWIDAALQDVSADILVVTDARFANEAEAIRVRGGWVWEIVRPGHDLTDTSHPSEQRLDETLIDLSIVNHSDLSVLRMHVFQALNHWVTRVGSVFAGRIVS